MSPVHCSTSHPFVITGSAEAIGELLCGPAQHNDHCKAWRWREYVQHDKERMANVWAELDKMHAERRAKMSSQQQADLALAEWQSHRRARA
jgi:hypothetical protein